MSRFMKWHVFCMLLTEIVPHVRLPAQLFHIDDGLTKEVIRLPFQVGHQLGFEVVVLVPYPNLYRGG